MDEDDTLVVRAVAEGDRRALAKLYDRYASVMLAIGQRILGNPREAEDLLHDVFLEVWRQASTFERARGTVRSWLFIRMRSRALDRYRSARTNRATEELPVHIEAAPTEEDPALGPDRQRLRLALSKLPPEQRTVLELGYFEGLSCSEIAARVEVPIGTVKSRVASALAKLREGLNAGEANE